MLRIFYTVREREEAVFETATGQAIIGRPKPGVACDLDLSPDDTVSRPHARISLDEHDQHWIEDLNSKHGTKINGHTIKGLGKKELYQGDQVTIGETKLRIEQIEQAPKTTSVGPADEEAKTPPGVQEDEQPVTLGLSLDAQTSSALSSGEAATESERKLSLIYELPLLFAKETSLDGLLQKIVDKLVEVIPGARRGALLTVCAESSELMLKAYLPVGQPVVSMKLAHRAVDSRQGFIWEADEDITTGTALAQGIGTGMYAPLIWREGVLGVICVDNPKREDVFAEEDLRLLLGVAHYAAMSVTHQRAVDDLARHQDLANRLFGARFPLRLRDKLVREAANGELPVGTRHSNITFLCSDIRGFTKLTAKLGARRTGDLLNEYFPPLVEAVLEHGGTIERFVGDAIFAVFGSPEPDGRHQENAVCAALDMQIASAAVMKARAVRKAETCEIGIGIHCGEALHGFIGNAERLEFAVIGEPPNLASRYCAMAGKGEILLSPEVHAHVFNKFPSERILIPTKHEGTLVAYRLQNTEPAPVR